MEKPRQQRWNNAFPSIPLVMMLALYGLLKLNKTLIWLKRPLIV